MRVLFLIAALLLLPACALVGPDYGFGGDGSSEQSGDLFRLGLDETARVGIVSVGFKQLVADSRCALNVICFWEGQAVVELSVDPGSEPEYLARLVSGGRLEGDVDRVAVGDLEVRLMEVSPYPEDAENPPAAGSYEVLLRIGPVE